MIPVKIISNVFVDKYLNTGKYKIYNIKRGKCKKCYTTLKEMFKEFEYGFVDIIIINKKEPFFCDYDECTHFCEGKPDEDCPFGLYKVWLEGKL